MKYLIANLGLGEVVRMVEEERTANKSKSYPINLHILPETQPPAERPVPEVQIENEQKYQAWLKTNVKEQKQEGFYRVNIKVTNGDISTGTARKLVNAVRRSEEHTSELQSLMRISYAVFCLKKKTKKRKYRNT